MLRLKSELTLVLVTHDLEQALRVSDYVAFMKFGSIVRWGAAEEVQSGWRDAGSGSRGPRQAHNGG